MSRWDKDYFLYHENGVTEISRYEPLDEEGINRILEDAARAHVLPNEANDAKHQNQRPSNL